jgi:hypothetical protein
MNDLADKEGPGGEGIAVAVQKPTDRSSNRQISTAAALEYGRDGKRFGVLFNNSWHLGVSVAFEIEWRWRARGTCTCLRR